MREYDGIDQRESEYARVKTLVSDVFGLNMADFIVLASVCATEAPLPLSAIRNAYGMGASYASRALSKLEKAGLVLASACDDDMRGLVLYATEEGEERYRACEARLNEALGDCPISRVLDHYAVRKGMERATGLSFTQIRILLLLAQGDSALTEAQLCRKLRVKQNTAHAALDVLREKGLVDRGSARDWRITEKGVAAANVASSSHHELRGEHQ